MPGRFEEVVRLRPVCVVSTVTSVPLDPAGPIPLPRPAPYAALEARLVGRRGSLSLSSGADRLLARLDDGAVELEVTADGRTTTHRSRRHRRPVERPTALGLALTGTHLTVLTQEAGAWIARGRVDLEERLDTRHEPWLAALHAEASGPLADPRAGSFGLLGLRDVRLVTHADGTAYERPGDPGARWLTATSAGPGFFDTAHTSIWRLDATLTLSQTAHVWFRRPDRPGAYGDHATHLVRDSGRWLVATSTWGDFDASDPDRRVRITYADSDADLLTGEHLLDTAALALAGHDGVGSWDPHLVRIDGTWHLGLASARRYFDFHPALATGPSLDDLRIVAAATGRRATEGTTLHRLDGRWVVLASDGRDSPRALRERFPVLDLGLREIGVLDAPYPTNIPWPTLLETPAGRLLVTFDGTRAGGPLPGYGTHGDLVIMREG